MEPDQNIGPSKLRKIYKDFWFLNEMKKLIEKKQFLGLNSENEIQNKLAKRDI